MKNESFQTGHQYRLVIPERWLKIDAKAILWHLQIVTYFKTGTNMEEIRDEVCYNTDPAPFTAWVKGPEGLSTNYVDNIFAAEPQWLQEIYLSPFTGKIQ